jgi:hypothetical protein
MDIRNNLKTPVHKSYWIGMLRDKGDDRRVKREFVRCLGFDCPLEAADFLEEAEQTTFIGSWFLTDDEVLQEEDKLNSGKLSIHAVEFEPEIRILKEAVANELENLESHMDGFEKYIKEMAKSNTDKAEEIVKSLMVLVRWAQEIEKDTGELSRKASAAITMLDLIEASVDDPTKMPYYLDMATNFVQNETLSDWALGRGMSSKLVIGEG